LSKLAIGVFAFALGGCFTYNPADGAVKCGSNAAHPCPKGYYCASATHTCYRNGSIAPGTPCTGPSACPGGHCVDGVCCNNDCSGTCERCDLPGSVGTCSPIAMGSDPDQECGPKSSAQIPDGGSDVTLDVTACAGTCSGNRSCTYPGASTTCGAPFCTSVQAQQPTCDGNGGCALQSTDCGGFACATGACKKTCSALSDCQPQDYCNVNINQCVTKKADGLPCSVSSECQHGYCVPPVAGTTALCCNTACTDIGMSCDKPGQEGTCACQGMTCAAGCQLFYRDADNDQHGDETGTLANGRAIAGCIGTPMISQGGFNWYPNDIPNKGHLDCDDTDNNVFWGQTTFFDSPSLHRGFDYDCDGTPVKETAEYNTLCHICHFRYDPPPGTYSCHLETSCDSSPDYLTSGLNCGFYCYVTNPPSYRCCATIKTGFTGPNDCGQNGNISGHPYAICGDCPGINSNPTDSYDYNKKQRCH
jgi:hypothetical protein